MNHVNFIIFLGLFVAVTISQKEINENEKKIVCYYANWSGYRPANNKFSPNLIDPNLCTHLIYAFATFSKDYGLTPSDEYQDIELNGFKVFNGLKEQNENLKTLLSIGGWTEGSLRFSETSAVKDKRDHFVQSTIDLLRKHNFDGINLDWQFPCFREGSRPEDKEHYVTLVEDLRKGFEDEAKKSNRSRLLISLSIPSEVEYIEKGFDLVNLQKYADFLNILSYDYHISSEPKVAHHAPLYSLPQEIEENSKKLNADATVQYLLDKGLEKEKLNLGIPTYGRSFKLQNKEVHELGAPAKQVGPNEKETRAQYLPYYELCKIIKENNWTVEHANKSAVGPFAYKDDEWVGYDDEAMVYEKAKYVREKGLGGIMFWTLDEDDHMGHCGSKRFPLITAGREGLLGKKE